MHQVSEQIKERYYKDLQNLVNTWVQLQRNDPDGKSFKREKEIQKVTALYHFWTSIDRRIHVK